MALTQFPVETDQPTIEVTLPVGRHTLELVVEDSAGLKSEPDSVTITVGAEIPKITSIVPEEGWAGTTLDATIIGENLLGANRVEFTGEGISASILSGAAETLSVRLDIAADAPANARSFEVHTPAGVAYSPEGVVFTVKAAPLITSIDPAEGVAGGGIVYATIRGENLLGATVVEFIGEGISASILSIEAEALSVRLTIAADAPANARSFEVHTPAGVAYSPAGVVFTVKAAPLITSIDPAEGVAGTTLDATIRGENLLIATRVLFGNVGIPEGSVSILSREAEALSVRFDIAADAPAGAQRFAVLTPAGVAFWSPAGVVFTVKAGPLITSIDPAEGVAGTTLDATIIGKNLLGATKVGFRAGGISASILGGTAEALLVRLDIAADAPVGTPVSFLVYTPIGTADSQDQGVMFTVKAGPLITSIDPAEGVAGTTLDATIIGENLLGATEAGFRGVGISASIRAEGTAEALPVALDIAADAPVGAAQSFVVYTPAGVADSQDQGVVFTVKAALPLITSIDPAESQGGTTVTATIRGENLLDATDVWFRGVGISASILIGGTAKALPVALDIAADAPPGARSFVVYTPAGVADSPAGVLFTITAEPPQIKSITPAEGQGGTTVLATIEGVNLLGAKEVQFSGTGIRVVIHSGGTATQLTVQLEINEGAPEGARSFTVATPAGVADSPVGVVFTVKLASPRITGIDPSIGFWTVTMDAMIMGKYLSNATSVQFFNSRSEPTGIRATIKEGGTDVQLPVELQLDDLGPYSFSVRTPAGAADSPEDVRFTVVIP